MVQKIAYVAAIVSVISMVSASCSNPKISNLNSFSTSDATIVTKIAYIGEFTLMCDNNESPQLFAELEGKVTPVARVGDNAYQLSWSEDIKKARSGDFNVRLFDEEGFSNVRKAQRAGESSANVNSLADVIINSRGAYKGPWINSELLAVIIAVVTSYFALSTKSKLLS